MLLSINTTILPSVIVMGSITYKNPWIHFSRVSNEFILYIIESGELYIKEDEKEFVLKKGDSFILQPNKQHMGFKKAPCSYYFIHFKHSGIDETSESKNELIKNIMIKRKQSLTSDSLSAKINTSPISFIPKHYNIASKQSLLYLFRLLKDGIGDYNQKYEDFKVIASCKLQELLLQICRVYVTTEIEKPKTDFSKSFVVAHEIINYINKEYCKKLSGDMIEETFEMNYDYLNRIFSKMTGFTILSYLNNVRMNKAKELIETTPLKFSEIGYLVGIDNQYYFSRLFKKYVGMTPSQYLKKTSFQLLE